MTTQFTLVARLFYGGLTCCLVVFATYIFFDKDASTSSITPPFGQLDLGGGWIGLSLNT